VSEGTMYSMKIAVIEYINIFVIFCTEQFSLCVGFCSLGLGTPGQWPCNYRYWQLQSQSLLHSVVAYSTLFGHIASYLITSSPVTVAYLLN